MLNDSVLAAAALIVNALLTAEVSPTLDAVRFFEPERLMLRSLKVARPFGSVNCVVVPLSVPVPVVKTMLIDTPALETLLLNKSCS